MLRYLPWLILNLASKTNKNIGGSRRTGLVPLSCRVFPTLFFSFELSAIFDELPAACNLDISWSATCTPWSGKASEGYWNGIHKKLSNCDHKKGTGLTSQNIWKWKKKSGLAYPWPSGSEALRPATRWIPWIMPGLIVDYHAGETGRHWTFRIFLARKIGCQYSILCSDPMGETWFTRKWDDDGWFISKLGMCYDPIQIPIHCKRGKSSALQKPVLILAVRNCWRIFADPARVK